MEMQLVAYYAQPESEAECDREGCTEPAHYRVDAMDARLTEHLCGEHVAQHMRGNAYAIAGTDPDAANAGLMGELDNL